MNQCQSKPASDLDEIRSTWTRDEIAALFDLPFIELVYRAQTVHRRYHDPQRIQLSTLLSIKTGGCPEDCAYCPQSTHHAGSVEATKMLKLDEVVAAATLAKQRGSSRFCMGAAWRSPKDRDLDIVCRMITEVKALGLETCVTLGMLSPHQAVRLKDAGLDFYNHNLDTSPESYASIISTRTYQERLDTLAAVRAADINVCCGGILGMNESVGDRVGLIHTLATMPRHPESVPINMLVRVEGTPLAQAAELDPIEFVRAIAVARITMPASMVRLSAGRDGMSDETQCLCYLAGANSIFYGEKLLTTPNNPSERDSRLLDRLGMEFLDSPVAN